jgi:hypothetical protein
MVVIEEKREEKQLKQIERQKSNTHTVSTEGSIVRETTQKSQKQ